MRHHSLPKRFVSGEMGERGTTRTGGKAERIDGTRDRGSPGVWHHGGLEYRRTRHLGVVQHGIRRGLQVYGRIGEGKGKASENRQRKREPEEADKVEVAPGVTVGSLRRFRAASLESTQELLKRLRLR